MRYFLLLNVALKVLSVPLFATVDGFHGNGPLLPFFACVVPSSILLSAISRSFRRGHTKLAFERSGEKFNDDRLALPRTL